MSDVWFFANSGQGYGPFSESQIRDLGRLGLIADIDLVWKSGDDTSVIAASLVDLVPTATRPRWDPIRPTVWSVVLAIPLGFVGVGWWIVNDLNLLNKGPREPGQPAARASNSPTPKAVGAGQARELSRVERLAVSDSPAVGVDASSAATPSPSALLHTHSSSPSIAGPEATYDDIVRLFRPERDVVQGRWALEGNSFVSGAGGGTLALPVAPASNFELVLHVTRLEGRTGFSIGIMRDDLKATVLLDHWEGSGLELIDRKRRTDNGTYIKRSHFVIGRSSEVRLVVDGSSITCSVDGDQVIEWRGDFGRLSPSGIQKEHGAPLGKICLYSDGRSAHKVNEISLRRLGP